MRLTSRPTASGLTCVLGALGLLLGCGGAPSPLDPDLDWEASSRPAGAAPALLAPPRPRLLPVAKRRPWAHASAGPSFLAVPGREPSEHGVAGHERTVLVDESARAYADGHPHAPWPTGARLVERLHPAGSDGVALMYAMTKLAPGSSPGTLDWAFEVLDASWRVAVEGDLSACVRCHAEAPHAGIFGPPRRPDAPL